MDKLEEEIPNRGTSVPVTEKKKKKYGEIKTTDDVTGPVSPGSC